MSKKRLLLAGILASCVVGYMAFPTARLSYPCAFCKAEVVQRQKIFEDDLVYALYTNQPAMDGHCLIIPKRHVERFTDLSREEIAQLGEMVQKVDKAVSKAFQTSSYLLLQKNGEESGQTVPHVHIHYMPRQEGDRSVLKFLWNMLVIKPLSHSLTPEEIAEKIAKTKRE